jgi:hypothetical protein
MIQTDFSSIGSAESVNFNQTIANWQEPISESVIFKIIDVVRPIFLAMCWGLIVFCAGSLGMIHPSLTSLVGTVLSLHMIIQGV